MRVTLTTDDGEVLDRLTVPADEDNLAVTRTLGFVEGPRDTRLANSARELLERKFSLSGEYD